MAVSITVECSARLDLNFQADVKTFQKRLVRSIQAELKKVLSDYGTLIEDGNGQIRVTLYAREECKL